MRQSFLVPNLDFLKEIPSSDSDKIVVVSIIGKTAFSSYGFKVKELGRMFSSDTHRKNSDLLYTIEGYYDEENQIVYLHAHTLLDTDCILKNYESIRVSERYKNDEYDFLSAYDEVKTNIAKIMLFLFYVSHIVILSHPGSSFDTNYIQYFKALNTLGQKLSTKASKYFEHLDISKDWSKNGRTCIPRLLFYFEKCPKGATNVKKLEHNMEDKIYHILKKTRILSAPYPIFALPLNQEFVYVSKTPVIDAKGEMLKGLIADCEPGGAIKMTAPFSTQVENEHSFKHMLKEHIKQARTKGFNDPVNPRHTSHVASHFELPILSSWVDVTKIMYERLIITKFSAHLNVETKFSEQRCMKVLPIALAKYQEGLPSHYGKAEHEARLAMAMNLFRAQARGALYPKFAKQLQSDCLEHWTNGRQQCEAPSLTGNPCKLPKHDSDQEHMSGFIYKAACDCGRKIGSREDPYNAKQANYLFYQQVAKECYCSKLERISFPVFEPSTKEFKAACLVDSAEERPTVLSDRSECTSPDIQSCDSETQPSTTEYLPGMLTLTSPSGLLPAFSSWSLVSIGLSSLYSHNIGLSESHHPGFLSSTNYLLPWDVTVYTKAKANMWPQLSRSSTRGRRGRSTGSLPQFTVKVFIGMEYECPQGHKFMLASPDKILKATPGSMVKDTGHKIAESDMPLYFQCACRAAKIAQLMRIHIVTPKAPVHCTLNPRVQPGSNAPIFVPTLDGPLKLSQSSYWVLRLPYVYVAENEHFPQNNYARLLKDTFGVTEAD
ncbi:protein SMG8 [Coccinella septempunctata]|uniref:protein SMG8 n=1 Tax=Coccinella septempunctata TaxID=41139 RepID=UPI001D07D287|nr:protein SMG8 [Coccinella septempunctata]